MKIEHLLDNVSEMSQRYKVRKAAPDSQPTYDPTGLKQKFQRDDVAKAMKSSTSGQGQYNLATTPKEVPSSNVPAVSKPTTDVAPINVSAQDVTPANAQQSTAVAQPKTSAWDKAKAVGRGARDTAIGLAKGVGDVAAQTAGGVSQTVGAAAGGLKHGYQTARQGQTFGDKNSFGNSARDALGIKGPSDSWNQNKSNTTSGGGTFRDEKQKPDDQAPPNNQIAAVNDEVDQLKYRLGKIEQLVRAQRT